MLKVKKRKLKVPNNIGRSWEFCPQVWIRGSELFGMCMYYNIKSCKRKKDGGYSRLFSPLFPEKVGQVGLGIRADVLMELGHGNDLEGD